MEKIYKSGKNTLKYLARFKRNNDPLDLDYTAHRRWGDSRVDKSQAILRVLKNLCSRPQLLDRK